MVRDVRFLKYLAISIVTIALTCALSLSLTSLASQGRTVVPGPVARTIANQTSPSKESEDTRSDEETGDGETASSEGLRPFDELIEDLDQRTGLVTVYSDLAQGKAYLALKPEQLNQNFLLIATLESGLGEAGLFRGWPLNDLLIQFQEIPQNRLQVVVPNTYIRSPGGHPWQQPLRDSSFSDSVLFAIKVVSIDPESQARLIDLSDLLMKRDVANLARALGWATSGYVRDSELSRLTQLNPFPDNVEISTRVGFSGGSSPVDSLAALLGVSLRSLPDSRGFSLGVRYSLSALPQHSRYRPRLADERVGYFLSAFRKPPQADDPDPFVRYINRWHLEKQQPDAELSPPKQPLVFWLENTVPPEYRQALRSGVLLWNTAFEAAGFENAIEVRQMPAGADWDPADVRYNVIRWSDSLTPGPIGIGPSRVNPFTGEILDADVIIDANTIRVLQRQYQSWIGEDTSASRAYLEQCGQRSQTWYLQWLALQTWKETANVRDEALPIDLVEQISQPMPDRSCAHHMGHQHTAFGALALSILGTPDITGAALDTYIQQYLVALTAHEVGHVLGLRHNFAGSRFLPPEDLSSVEIARSQGLLSSIMDYFPPNIAPPGADQGDYFPTQLGPYDRWAIEYGYRPAPASPLNQVEQRLLTQIAARSTAPELAYATDEDISDFIDPEVNAWDLSSDPLQYAEWQLENAQAVWKRLNRLSVNPQEGYGSLRRRMNLVFSYFQRNALTITNYVGGQRFRRLRPWDAHRQTPLEPVPAAKQRQALAALNQQVFAPGAFQFSPELLNQLPPDRWRHWGAVPSRAQLDYPIYERVLAVQSTTLSNLMLSERLARIRDIEFKAPPQEDVLTLSELFETIYQNIWAEVADPATAVLETSSLRRGLQRHHLNILAGLVLRRTLLDALSAQSFTDFIALVSTLGAPEDARVLARYQLRQISEDVQTALANHSGEMEVTLQAHLEAVRDRIVRVLDAPLLGL